MVSQLDPCLYSLRNKNGKLLGICGFHVDDLIGGGEREMDVVLSNRRKQLPFGDFRTFTIWLSLQPMLADLHMSS